MLIKNNIKKICKFALIAILLTIVVFTNADNSFQGDSEDLVLGPMAEEILSLDFETYGYGLGKLASLDYPDEYVSSYMNLQDQEQWSKGFDYSVYRSQIGLQGHLCRVITHFLRNYHLLAIRYLLKLVCSFLFTVIMMLIICQIYKRYGFLLAFAFGSVTCFSSWPVNFSSNLYWVEFTWFVPMLLGLLWLNYENWRVWIYPIFFLSIFLKCLCGYEYLSSVMLAGIMFILVEWICKKEQRKTLMKGIFLIGICCILGFCLAYLYHAYIYGYEDILNGLKKMQVDLIQRRTYGNADNYSESLRDSLNASVWAVIVKYFSERLDGKIMLLMVVFTCLSLAYQRIYLKRSNRFEISMFFVSLLIPLSWLVLAKGHSYIHTHMNFVLFYMGWVQSCVYILCKVFLEAHDIKALNLEEP